MFVQQSSYTPRPSLPPLRDIPYMQKILAKNSPFSPAGVAPWKWPNSPGSEHLDEKIPLAPIRTHSDYACPESASGRPLEGPHCLSNLSPASSRASAYSCQLHTPSSSPPSTTCLSPPVSLQNAHLSHPPVTPSSSDSIDSEELLADSNEDSFPVLHKLGWFDPDCFRVHVILKRARALGWTSDDLYDAWFSAPTGPTYGTERKQNKPRRPPAPPERGEFQTEQEFQAALTKHKQDPHKMHKILERRRRGRHFRLQNFMHSITCDVANVLMPDDPDFVVAQKNKPPGKDHQLISSIWDKYIVAVVAQLQHAELLKKTAKAELLEDKIEMLLRENQRLRRREHIDGVDGEHDAETHFHVATDSPRKRRKVDNRPAKHLKAAYSARSSLSPHLPSPSPSFTSRHTAAQGRSSINPVVSSPA